MIDNIYHKLKTTVETIARTEIAIISNEWTDARLKICSGCEHCDENFMKCKACGCWIPAKVRVSTSKCPMGKWHPIQILNE